MRATRSVPTVGVSALLIALLASPSAAQYESRRRAPYNAARLFPERRGASSNITPAIEVSEDAYVFAVSLDLDSQIPESSIRIFLEISVRILQHKQLRLPNFFAGFSHGEAHL